jgi:hypothetical protein
MSKTFLLGAGLTDLGGFGRYLGPKQGKSKCFQRIREIRRRAHIGIKSSGHCSTRQELQFQPLFISKTSVEVR